MGSPDFAVPSLEALHGSGFGVVGVYAQPDQPAGRGRALQPPPVKTRALELGLPVYQPQTFRAEAVRDELRALRPDVIVVAAYGRILPQAVLDIPPRGCLNVHPSLLPRWRGPSPVQAAILAGDGVTGVSIMQMTAKMDAGPVLAQRTEPVREGDTGGSLSQRLARLGAVFLVETLQRWLDGRITPVPQDEAKATYCKLITKEHGELDWTRPADALWRQVRAYQPWPGAYTWWKGKLLKVIEARAVAGATPAPPGTVVRVDGGVAVAAGEGTALALRTVQMEGKKALEIGAFLAGARDFVGARLGK